jgi:AcrR family transcriptional regulator
MSSVRARHDDDNDDDLASGAPTDARLLEVAERLFAEHGIDAVSVRAITIEAGANIAAVHYHFGNKVDLIRALVERRVNEVNTVRAQLLHTLDAADAVTPRDVAEMWVRPLAGLALDDTRRAYLGFLVALDHAGPDLRAIANTVFQPHFARIDAALARALPGLDAATRRFRFGLLTSTSLRALADLDKAGAPWRRIAAPIASDALVEALIDAMTGLLVAPPTTGAPGARTEENR